MAGPVFVFNNDADKKLMWGWKSDIMAYIAKWCYNVWGYAALKPIRRVPEEKNEHTAN